MGQILHGSATTTEAALSRDFPAIVAMYPFGSDG